VLHREHGGRGTAADTNFGVDVLDVVVGRLRRDAEPVPDRLCRQAWSPLTAVVAAAAGPPVR
jgi:hypothetical protein